VTFQSPATDRYGYDARYLRGRIVGALGGRAAEEIIYGNVTTGAESDLEQVTAIAKQMVGRWGMSDKIGLVSVLPGPNDEPTLFPGNGAGPSEETRQIIDSEVRRIVEESYERAVALLRENRDRLERLAHALLEHETLDERDAYETAGFPPPAGSDERAGRADAPSAAGVGVSTPANEPSDS
jgi:cell division protease FtsH